MAGVDDDRLQFLTLYAARFAEGFGFITLITLLPYYINALDPSATTVLRRREARPPAREATRDRRR